MNSIRTRNLPRLTLNYLNPEKIIKSVLKSSAAEKIYLFKRRRPDNSTIRSMEVMLAISCAV